VPVASSNNRAAGGTERQTERAEQVVSDLERTAEQVAAKAGDWIARAAERLREEAEDIWAEAQGIRRRG
jgi:methyl-accepting chemotaxis protein